MKKKVDVVFVKIYGSLAESLLFQLPDELKGKSEQIFNMAVDAKNTAIENDISLAEVCFTVELDEFETKV